MVVVFLRATAWSRSYTAEHVAVLSNRGRHFYRLNNADDGEGPRCAEVVIWPGNDLTVIVEKP